MAGLLAAVLAGRAQAPAGPATPPQPPAEVELVAVGDILMHQDVKTAALAAGGPAGLWAEVIPLLRRADVAFANLETPVAPRTGQPGRPFQFNAPEDLPGALRASGFTVLSTANNHAFDQGHKGLAETLERLEAAGLLAVGSGPTRAQAEQPRILAVKGLRIAFLGFTDIFNANLDGSKDRPWVRPMDPAAAAAAVRAARAQADAVVVSIHWGAEYQHAPLARQRAIATQLAEAGADLILGHHPHVLQPVTRLGRTVVAYSMGNFIANQDRIYRPGQDPAPAGDSRDGVAVRCRLVQRRQADGALRVEVEDVACEPLWTENNWREMRAGKAKVRSIRVVPVNAALAQAERDLRALRAADPVDRPVVAALEARMRTLEVRRQRVREVLGQEFIR